MLTVIGIPDTPDRWLDARHSQPLGVPKRQVLDTAVTVVHQSLMRRPGVERLF